MGCHRGTSPSTYNAVLGAYGSATPHRPTRAGKTVPSQLYPFPVPSQLFPFPVPSQLYPLHSCIHFQCIHFHITVKRVHSQIRHPHLPCTTFDSPSLVAVAVHFIGANVTARAHTPPVTVVAHPICLRAAKHVTRAEGSAYWAHGWILRSPFAVHVHSHRTTYIPAEALLRNVQLTLGTASSEC